MGLKQVLNNTEVNIMLVFCMIYIYIVYDIYIVLTQSAFGACFTRGGDGGELDLVQVSWTSDHCRSQIVISQVGSDSGSFGFWSFPSLRSSWIRFRIVWLWIFFFKILGCLCLVELLGWVEVWLNLRCVELNHFKSWSSLVLVRLTTSLEYWVRPCFVWFWAISGFRWLSSCQVGSD